MPDTNAPTTAPEESQVAVTKDQEVEEAAKELDKLRAAIVEEREKRARMESDLSHDIRMTDLDVEKARLLAELADEQRLTAKVDTSSNATLQNAEDAMRAAVARIEAVGDLNRAEAKAKSDATPNPLLTDTPVPDAAAPSVVATSAPVVPKSTTTTGKAAK